MRSLQLNGGRQFVGAGAHERVSFPRNEKGRKLMLLTILGLAALASPAGTTTVLNPAELTWFDGPFMSAVGKARNEKTSVLIYFWSDKSESCGSMYEETIQSDRTNDVLTSNILVSANYNTDAGAALFKRFNVSVLPTVMVIGANGSPEDAIVGYIDPDGFLAEFERIARGEGTVSDLRTKAGAEKAGTDKAIAANWKLAGKLADLGQGEEHDALLVVIREADPKARTVIGARAHLWHLQKQISDKYSGEGQECACSDDKSKEAATECPSCDAFLAADLGPLYTLVKQVREDEARFEVWLTIGNMEARREDVSAAIKAFKTANKVVPNDQSVSFPKGVANWIIDSEEDKEHTIKTKKFALEMAETCVKKARQLDPTSESYKKSYGDLEPRFIVAEGMAVLAFAYDLNGNKKKASKTANAVLELTGSDDYREYLTPLL